LSCATRQPDSWSGCLDAGNAARARGVKASKSIVYRTVYGKDEGECAVTGPRLEAEVQVVARTFGPRPRRSRRSAIEQQPAHGPQIELAIDAGYIRALPEKEQGPYVLESAGANALLQVRCAVLNGADMLNFMRWYPRNWKQTSPTAPQVV
jgi:hypothetical protein